MAVYANEPMIYEGELHKRASSLLDIPRKLEEIQALYDQASGAEKVAIGRVTEAYLANHTPDEVSAEDAPVWELIKNS